MFGTQSHTRHPSVISAGSLDRAGNHFDPTFFPYAKVFYRLPADDEPVTWIRRLQVFYEKSRLHYLLPIVVLVIYSFLGGFIFYTIESPEEQQILARKKQYIEQEEQIIMSEINRIQSRMRYFLQKNQTLELYLREVRQYKHVALNRLNKAVYWYVLQVYYLNDQESYKASLLHPHNPERLWKPHFHSNFGRILALKNYTGQLSNRCWEIGVDFVTPEEAEAKLKKSLKEFNKFTGLDHILTPTWTFWNSMFLAVTTYSTIGYGNISPKSRLGKLAAMVYAAIGIPLVLMILHKLGRFCLRGLEYLWNNAVWFMEGLSCVKDAEKLKGNMKYENGMPVLLAVGVAFGWMFLCAAIFLRFEDDWDYFKSFYFFFCSLTTIGYGDVTPTNSEDMFLMFGFIIIGLSLVSMCVNVIQLKLEELFEELLIAMMEEIGAQEAGLGGADIAPKLTLVDLWKVWKRRRNQNRQKQEQIEKDAKSGMKSAVPRKSFSEFNWWKIFPFAKRRREVLIHEFRNRLTQAHKETQTEPWVLHNLNYVSEIDEMSWNETSPGTSGSLGPSVAGSQNGYHTPANRSSPNRSSPINRSSPLSSNGSSARRVKVAISENSSSVSLRSSSSSSYAKRYLPSRNDRRHTTVSAGTGTTMASIKSAPISGPYIEPRMSPNSASIVEQYASQRRWTFFEIGKTPRGAPRGLVVPYMYMRRNALTHETTEIAQLIAEIDSRLVDCRSIVSTSRAVSRTGPAPGSSTQPE
ncbi:unnamed protein product [Bursaphelenchus okinawaensis]|uniref:Potassium channel domain-containing protein n=1 Tax=Bursaphelenchus okinawaensis TaxID=465554 RepID=A0A811LQ22_9BILA|nr:unnamed protein product [Bursaphelenchus okinawaensis]CAG9126145.1 unnamed protein product [Bursaphelenchus okinawaensis]